MDEGMTEWVRMRGRIDRLIGCRLGRIGGCMDVVEGGGIA